MDLTFSPEQEQLRDSVRRYLSEHHDFSARRRVSAEAGRHAALWRGLARDLGVLGIGVPETLGGAGGGAVEQMIVAEELGRTLSLEPYVDTVVVAGAALAAASGSHAADILRAIASGETIVALAFHEPSFRYALERTGTLARRSGDGWRLRGEKSAVTSAPFADILLITARTGGAPGERDGMSLFIVDARAPGIDRHDYPTIDGRRASDIILHDVTVGNEALLSEEGQAMPILDMLVDRGIAAIAAEGVGTMRRALVDTLEYTGMRRQFGDVLSERQALQHRITDMFVQLELASAAALLATLKLSAIPTERARATSTAKVTLSRAMRFIAQNAVQLHGGMGMTDELAVAHAFKRMTAIDAEFGTLDHHLRRYQNA